MKRPPFRVFLDEELLDGLKQLRHRSGASIGESIRRAVRGYLATEGIGGNRQPAKEKDLMRIEKLRKELRRTRRGYEGVVDGRKVAVIREAVPVQERQKNRALSLPPMLWHALVDDDEAEVGLCASRREAITSLADWLERSPAPKRNTSRGRNV